MTRMTGITVRQERPADEEAISRLNTLAFGGPDEAAIIGALRANGGVTLSLVAELDGDVVGHILFSPVSVERNGEGEIAVGLGPMAVMLEHQRRGVGSMLVREGLDRLRAAGHRVVVVLGHPEYYPRFGFERASRYGLRCEFDCPDEAFMVTELCPGALANGAATVRYRPEFRAA